MRRPTRFPTVFALFAAISALHHSPATAEETATEATEGYIRFFEADDAPTASLQTAVAHYRRADGTQVDLIGVVHIGDEAYYKAFNESFKAYDALLFEMVGADPDRPITKEDLQKNKKNPLRFFQLLTAGMLEVKFQLDHIDYSAPNFVHADMDMETFQRRQAAKGENLLGLIEKGYESQQASDKKSQFDFNEMFKLFGGDSTPAQNKLTLGRQFQHIEGMLGGMEGKEGSVLVAERNLAALKVMDREIRKGKKKLGIFYGAAHLADFDKRLRTEHGFERTGTDWCDAWLIEKSAALPAAEPEAKPTPAPEQTKKAA